MRSAFVSIWDSILGHVNSVSQWDKGKVPGQSFRKTLLQRLFIV